MVISINSLAEKLQASKIIANFYINIDGVISQTQNSTYHLQNKFIIIKKYIWDYPNNKTKSFTFKGIYYEKYYYVVSKLLQL